MSAKVPTKLKIARGNPGKRPLPKGEPEPPAGPVEPPGSLSEPARAVWQRLSPDLTAMGLLRPVDATAFSALCEMVAEWEAAPAKVCAARFGQLRYLMQQFGMTPASRVALATGEAKKTSSDWDSLTA